MKLQLSLKKQWFDLTASGVKTEDYREINEYWVNRFIIYKASKEANIELSECIKNVTDIEWMNKYMFPLFKNFTSNKMTLGYPSKNDFSRIKEYEHLGIEIGYGKQEWGAEPNKLYFIIKHGKEIKP